MTDSQLQEATEQSDPDTQQALQTLRDLEAYKLYVHEAMQRDENAQIDTFSQFCHPVIE